MGTLFRRGRVPAPKLQASAGPLQCQRPPGPVHWVAGKTQWGYLGPGFRPRSTHSGPFGVCLGPWLGPCQARNQELAPFWAP